MPTYEYECKSCGHTFEVFQAMSDDPLRNCPKCGKEIRRLINGGTGVIFKGSGFYVTDKGKAAAPAKGVEKPAAAGEAKPPAGASTGEGKAASAAGESKAGAGTSEKKASGE
ncbi:MAG: zinc ribbon domain-containing protein [Treponema sp.]|jgi:putative FmdB family regulatory protein|nr:zinc ribbon domain-containing protein [Treponema sp.]